MGIEQKVAIITGASQGIGAGLRYTFPVGPIRLDAAWNPSPDEGDPDYVVHV